MECIRVVNAQHKVIIFCKSRPFNWQLECILKTITTKQTDQLNHHDYKAP